MEESYMPIQPTYPGVYIEEIPSGVHTITGVATSITAFIGRTPRGPVSEPTTITSFGDFERLFGGLDYATPLTYAVRDFFNNGGSQAIIVRLFKAADGAVAIATMTQGTLHLEAASAGSWSNDLAVYVTTDNITQDVINRYKLAKGDLFNLVVRQGKKGPVLERIPNVTYKDGERNITNVLQDSSQYLRVPEGTTFTGKPPDAMDLNGDPIPVTAAVDSVGLDQEAYLGGQEGEANKVGIYALNKADLFNLLVIAPDVRGGNTSIDVYSAAMALCVQRRAFLIVDSPHEWSDNKETAANTVFAAMTNANPQPNDPKDISPLSGEFARNAAIYFPRVVQADPLRGGQLDTFTPSGIVAGIMARTDSERGVWKAPAGLDASLSGIRGLNVRLNDPENGMLNPLGVNCIRSFPVNGTVIWGARTLRGADQLGDDYKYVPVRRLALFIEESLYRGTQWVVFEPNDEPLWAQIRLNVGAFMHNLFRQGAFQGQTPREAYLVKCDKETTTQNDINLGIVNILVAFAPLKPAEFVVIQIQQLAGQIEV